MEDEVKQPEGTEGASTPAPGAENQSTNSAETAENGTKEGDGNATSTDVEGQPEAEKTQQEKNAERIKLIKYIADSFDDLEFSDEEILLGLSRRKGMTAERRGAIEAFVERLKEVR